MSWIQNNESRLSCCTNEEQWKTYLHEIIYPDMIPVFQFSSYIRNFLYRRGEIVANAFQRVGGVLKTR